MMVTNGFRLTSEVGQSLYDRGLALFSSTGKTHPFPVYRAKLIHDWAQSEDYARILAGDYATLAPAPEPPPPPPPTCAGCSAPLTAEAKFCGRCGTQVGA